jgi:hypothetical protein
MSRYQPTVAWPPMFVARNENGFPQFNPDRNKKSRLNNMTRLSYDKKI